VPSTLALGTSELSEVGIFLKYPVVFPKPLNLQVHTVLAVNKIKETKRFEQSAAPVNVRVYRRLSMSESGLFLSVGKEVSPSRGGLFTVLIDECHLQ